MVMRVMQGPVRVVLDYAQECKAHAIGFQRITDIQAKTSWASRRNKNITNFHDAVTESAEAVGSEIAVAQYFGIAGFEPTVNTFKGEADIGARVEVKWTKYQNGHLIITDNDRTHDVAVLVVGRSPAYLIMGWIPISMAKKPRYRRHEDNSYWISSNNLFPIEDLRESIYGEGTI